MVQIRSINFSLIFLKTVDVVTSHRRCPKLLISVKYMEMLSNVQRIDERSEKIVQFTENLKQERSKVDAGLSNVPKIVEHCQWFPLMKIVVLLLSVFTGWRLSILTTGWRLCVNGWLANLDTWVKFNVRLISGSASARKFHSQCQAKKLLTMKGLHNCT